MLFLSNTLDFIQNTFLWVTSWQITQVKIIFWLSRFCTSNLYRWRGKENKWLMFWKGQQLWASVNDVVSTYQIIRRLNQSRLCRTAELWEKNIMSFRQMFPWANIISTVESERESLVYPSHHPKHTPTWELKQAPHSYNVTCPSTYPLCELCNVKGAVRPKGNILSLYTVLTCILSFSLKSTEGEICIH